MKKSNKLIIGALTGVTAVSAFFLTNDRANSEVANYHPREHKFGEKHATGIEGAFEYYAELRKNVETGQVNPEDFFRGYQESQQIPVDRATVGWKDHGPDNVGGRTRAILIDQDDDNHLFAGSVSGGLFESINRGNTWSKVEGFVDNLGISSMCQTDDGTIYVATGHSAESVNGTTSSSGMDGAGVFVSSDGGSSFSLVSGTENYSYINEVVSQGNDIFIAASAGLIKYSDGTLTAVSDVPTGCKALSISPDEQVIVAGASASKTYVSEDGGNTFTDVSGSISSGGIPQGAGRIEYAISHEQENGKYYVYASAANSYLVGVYMSSDNGMTWSQIAPANTGVVGAFAPFSNSISGQGTYDNIISCVKGNPQAILLGGIDVFAKSTNGNWEERSNGFVSPSTGLYVHSDQHEMQWDSQGRLWIGNDGGVFFSDDNGNSFNEANRGYNVTQFYKIGFSAHGDVIGGAQDNGTQANYHDNHTYREHDAVGGGDGFGCAMSFMNRDFIYYSVYYGALYRSSDRGVNSSSYTAANMPSTYGTPGTDLGSFNTCIELYENPNDVNSQDTIVVLPTQSYSAGDEIEVSSLTSQQTIDYTTPVDLTFDDTLNFDSGLTTQDTVVVDFSANDSYNVNLYTYSFHTGAPTIEIGDTLNIDGTLVSVDSIYLQNHYYGTNPNEPGEVIDMYHNEYLLNIPWDTIRVVDPYQSWFAFGLGAGEGVWLTRNALRFSASHDGFIKAGSGMSGVVTTMEFSADGDHLFIGTANGQVWRLSGLNNVYSPDPDTDTMLDYDNGHTATTFTQVGSFGVFVTNISSDKQDPDHLVVSLGYSGGNEKIQESTNATGTSPTFTGIQGDLPFSTNVPFYSVVIDREDPNTIFAGCDYGVFMTENGGTNWVNVSGDFGNVPVYDMGQNWRTWDEGNRKPGEIYIGTHGRGIWSTDALLSTEEAQDNLNENLFKADILIYPNPVKTNANLAINLTSNSDVTVNVFSLNGKLVQSIQEKELSQGEHIMTIDAQDLPAGTYIVNVKAGTYNKTTKFIKQ